MKPQLFLLHFAGGNCYSYRFLTPWLSDFDVVALELPGRGRRLGEELLKDMDACALDISRQIINVLRSDCFLIYGHSMGASLTLKVANVLQNENKFPHYLIVSGNPGPGIKSDKNLHLLTQIDFINELKLLGGIPSELLFNEELFSYFEPLLRADFEIVEKSDLISEPPVNTPLFAIMGTEEDNANQISNWRRYTRKQFDFEILEGDHFFIHKHPQRIADIITKCYKSRVANNFFPML